MKCSGLTECSSYFQSWLLRNPLLNVSALGTDQSVQAPQGSALDNEEVKLHGDPYSLGQAERLLFLTAGSSREKSAEHATSKDLGHTELVGGACRSYFKTRGCGFSQKGEVGSPDHSGSFCIP